MFRMSDDRRLAGGPDDGDDVEAGGGVGGAVAGEIELGGPHDLLLLFGVHLFFGGGVVVGAGFYFDENQRLGLTGDDVDFAEVTAEVAHDDLEPLIAEIAGGHVFAAIAERVLWGL